MSLSVDEATSGRKPTMTTKADELFETVAETLIAAIEGDTGTWSKPWQTVLSGSALPVNALTQKPYQGMNSLYFWMLQANHNYPEALWATYKQWSKLGKQVAKGQKGAKGIKWGVSYTCETEGKRTGFQPCSNPDHEVSKHMWASVFTVFNIAQTEGYEPPTVDDLGPAPERYANADALIAASGANIQHIAGDRAYFTPGTNDIVLPLREQFETSEGYYGTALHELTHWSGDAARLGRKQRNVFGSQGYAAEELVAELGSAMLNAHFGIEAEPHIEHAAYLKSWVSVIRSDKMALYRAAKQAQEAVNYLLGLAQDATEAEAEAEEVAAS